MSLRNSIKPTNRAATNIIINPSPATESANLSSAVPEEPSSNQPNGRNIFSFSKALRKICSLGLPIQHQERSTKLLDIKLPRAPRRKRIWCFQPRSEHTTDDNEVWVAFERKNQIKLNEKYDNRSADCDIRDRSIYRGEVTVKIMLRDGIGFIMDPEWQHVVYQIDFRPEMYWWQRLRYHSMFRKKIRNNPLYAYV
ncbi:hypothetical protein K501DRAFT_327812 [Backusella circina FSU 941]|nr:hypothetical protein K501DRAFT_327812 [Backusella circina FSU 941]